MFKRFHIAIQTYEVPFTYRFLLGVRGVRFHHESVLLYAQEVEAVNSSLVDDSEDLKRVYNKDIMFMMLKSIQELSEKNDTLEKRIEELEK